MQFFFLIRQTGSCTKLLCPSVLTVKQTSCLKLARNRTVLLCLCKLSLLKSSIGRNIFHFKNRLVCFSFVSVYSSYFVALQRTAKYINKASERRRGSVLTYFSQFMNLKFLSLPTFTCYCFK